MNPSRDLNSLVWLGVTLGLGLIMAPIFATAPRIDIEAANYFATAEGNGFSFVRHPVALWLNRLIASISEIGLSFLAVGLAFTLIWRRTFFGFGQKHYWFFIVSAVTGPILIVNVILKSYWGRARPHQIVEFGGAQEFSPAFVITDQCSANCSFVSGDVSAAFSLLALAVVISWHRKLWMLLVVVFGVIISLTRMAQGAHFLSDVIYAGLITAAIVFAVKYIVLDSRLALGQALERGANFAIDKISIGITRLYWTLRGGIPSNKSFADVRLDYRLRTETDRWLKDFGITDLSGEASAANQKFLQASLGHKLWTFFQADVQDLKVAAGDQDSDTDTDEGKTPT